MDDEQLPKVSDPAQQSQPYTLGQVPPQSSAGQSSPPQFQPQSVQSVPPAPEQAPMPPLTQSQPAEEPTQPQQKWKLILIISAIVAGLVLAAAAVLFMPPKQAAKTTLPVDGAPIESLASQGRLTAGVLKSLDKENAFWAYFSHASQQSIITLTKEYYFTNSPEEKPTSISAKRTGFDYSSKKIVQAFDSYSPLRPNRDRTRCYDGKEYNKISTGTQPWREADSGKEMLCSLSKEANYVNDGMNTGGLTADQANVFIAEMRRQEGLVAINSVELVDKNGKQYLRFSVALRPVESGQYGYMGNQWWMWAFKKTGLDPDKHPYTYSGAGGEGMDIEYYVDPVSKLPVYAELSSTNAKSRDGKELPFTSYSHYRVQYEFGKMPDVTISNEQDIVIDW